MFHLMLDVSSTAEACDLCEARLSPPVWDKDTDTFLFHRFYRVTVTLEPRRQVDDEDVAFKLRDLERGITLCSDCLIDTLDGLLSAGVI